MHKGRAVKTSADDEAVVVKALREDRGVEIGVCRNEGDYCARVIAAEDFHLRIKVIKPVIKAFSDIIEISSRAARAAFIAGRLCVPAS